MNLKTFFIFLTRSLKSLFQQYLEDEYKKMSTRIDTWVRLKKFRHVFTKSYYAREYGILSKDIIFPRFSLKILYWTFYLIALKLFVNIKINFEINLTKFQMSNSKKSETFNFNLVESKAKMKFLVSRKISKSN